MSYRHITVPEGDKITLEAGTLNVSDNPIVAFIEGDGMGPDIWRAAKHVLDSAVDKAYGGKRRIAWMEVFAGDKANEVYGEQVWLPDETVDALSEYLIGIKGLTEQDITYLLDKADEAVKISRQREKKTSTLRGLTQINLFFEASTRTQASFELAGKRLGADVMNMSVGNSSVKKGETLIDTAMTLNAMRPDVLVIRHSSAGAAALLSQKVSCAVVNAGDGQHEHPTQALLDAFTIRERKGRIKGLKVAIVGDLLHSRRGHPPQ